MEDARRKFDALPLDKKEKAVSDVFCIQCQRSFRLDPFHVSEFRGTLMISGKCANCGTEVAKPV